MLSQREAFVRVCEHLCTHDGYPGHGYSQYSRLGDGTRETVDLGDGVRVQIAGGDRDCSAMVVTALQAVGVDVHGASYTGNLLNLTKNPLFKAYRRPTGYSARRGDIYLAAGHHTAVCTHGLGEPGGDQLCQFSISEKGTIDGREGDQTGSESNVRAFYEYPWDYTIAWTGDGEMIGEDDEVTDKDIEKIAQAVWNYQIGSEGRMHYQNTPAWQHMSFAHFDTSRLYKIATDTSDPTGRDVKMDDHDHIKWLAAGQAKQNEVLDSIVETLASIKGDVESLKAGEAETESVKA